MCSGKHGSLVICVRNSGNTYHCDTGTVRVYAYLSSSISSIFYIYKAEKLSVCLSDGHAAYSPDLARIDIVCADNEALIIRLL